MKYRLFLGAFAGLLLMACNTESSQLPDSYAKSLSEYRTELKKGRVKYLQLNGLHKLDSLNTIGLNSQGQFAFGSGKVVHPLGTINRQKDRLQFKAAKGDLISTELDSLITEMPLALDTYGSSEKLYYKQWHWQVITRSEHQYLRVWDTQNPAIAAFKGYDSYALNPSMILEGQFIYYPIAKEAAVKSQLGVNAQTQFIGQVRFEYDEQPHTLEVGSDGFTMVSDLTSGTDTYGGGRYLYLELPESDGPVTIDLNKLYNPPCSFSTYTTCLYPPKENHLPFEVLAGETMSQGKH